MVRWILLLFFPFFVFGASDVQIQGGLLFVSYCDRTEIWDLTQNPKALLSTITYSPSTVPVPIEVDGNRLFIYFYRDIGDNGIYWYDITDPSHPQWVETIILQEGYYGERYLVAGFPASGMVQRGHPYGRFFILDRFLFYAFTYPDEYYVEEMDRYIFNIGIYDMEEKQDYITRAGTMTATYWGKSYQYFWTTFNNNIYFSRLEDMKHDPFHFSYVFAIQFSWNWDMIQVMGPCFLAYDALQCKSYGSYAWFEAHPDTGASGIAVGIPFDYHPPAEGDTYIAQMFSTDLLCGYRMTHPDNPIEVPYELSEFDIQDLLGKDDVVYASSYFTNSIGISPMDVVWHYGCSDHWRFIDLPSHPYGIEGANGVLYVAMESGLGEYPLYYPDRTAISGHFDGCTEEGNELICQGWAMDSQGIGGVWVYTDGGMVRAKIKEESHGNPSVTHIPWEVRLPLGTRIQYIVAEDTDHDFKVLWDGRVRGSFPENKNTFTPFSILP